MENKRIILVVIVVVSLFCAGLFFEFFWRSRVDTRIQCYDEPSTNKSFPDFDIQKNITQLRSDKNIFFLETSCFSKDGYAKLNCRQACSVESAARMNPGMSVNLLYLSPSPPSNSTTKLIELLERQKVRVTRIKVADFFRGTPIEQWYAGGALADSDWPNIHMSDILRLVTLWKFGGLYLDLDVVVTTSLEDLTNVVGMESEQRVGSAVIGLTATGLGHEVAENCLRNLMETYDGEIWSDSSVGVLTRVLKKLCDTNDLKNVSAKACHGFQVLPTSAFFPFPFEQWNRYFTTERSEETMRLIGEARAIHVWNRMSASTKMQSDVPYALTAQKYCPLVYKHCDATF